MFWYLGDRELQWFDSGSSPMGAVCPQELLRSAPRHLPMVGGSQGKGLVPLNQSWVLAAWGLEVAICSLQHPWHFVLAWRVLTA